MIIKTMKQALLAAFVAVFAARSWAQPVLDVPFLPQAGTTVTLGGNEFSGADPGPAGADQTWDFSGLTQTFEESYIFMDPAATPFADLYPDANLAAQQPDTSYFYYDLTGSTVESIGFAKDQVGFGLVYTDFALDPERIISIPFTYNDSESDTFAGIQGALGFDVEISGTKSIEADAWGTLVLPSGEFMNTVRLREVRSQTSNSFTFESVIYRWISPERVFWLLELGENSNTGGVTDHLNRWALAPLTVGMADTPPEPAGFNILNTVVQSGDPIRIWSWTPTTGSLTFNDPRGRRIKTIDRTTLGREGMELSTMGLTSGVYLITFISNAKAQTARVVIQ